MRAEYMWRIDNPIQQKDGLRSSLPSFELTSVDSSYCTSKTNTGQSEEIGSVFFSDSLFLGTYTCLRARLVLRREFAYYLLHLYIPSIMLVSQLQSHPK
jgi:anionic glutamate receptor